MRELLDRMVDQLLHRKGEWERARGRVILASIRYQAAEAEYILRTKGPDAFRHDRKSDRWVLK